MPQRKQPRTLSDMSVEVYINIYYNVCNRWNLNLYNAMQIGRRQYRYVKRRVMSEIQQLKQILSEVAPLIQRIISTELVSSFAYSITFHFERNEYVRSLDIFEEERHVELCIAMFRSVLTPFLYDYEPDMFSLIFTWLLVIRNLDSVPGLRILSMNQRFEVIKSLNLSPVTLTGSALVATSIHNLKQLQAFHYTGDCTDEVVIQLGLNCSELTEVSVTYSFRVTNDCVPHLLLLSNLQFLDITGTRIDRLHYGQLLSGLPNISNVRFVNKLDDLLSHIGLETVDTVTQVYGVVNDINMQIQKFPKTEKFVLIEPDVHLSDITPPPDFDLSDLTDWTELRTLEILFGDCPTINLNAILTGIGDKLTDLTLKSVTDLNHVDIITLCKSLRNLSLNSCLISPLNADTPLNKQLPHFRKLLSLKIEKSINDQTDFSFIRYYVNLERIELIGIDIFTEEFMREAIKMGTLANLEECYINETEEGALTFDVLEQLLRHCSNLKIFGHTEKLDLLDTENILQLKHELSKQNFDIDIIP